MTEQNQFNWLREVLLERMEAEGVTPEDLAEWERE